MNIQEIIQEVIKYENYNETRLDNLTFLKYGNVLILHGTPYRSMLHDDLRISATMKVLENGQVFEEPVQLEIVLEAWENKSLVLLNEQQSKLLLL
jgi:hypothetical protein